MTMRDLKEMELFLFLCVILQLSESRSFINRIDDGDRQPIIYERPRHVTPKGNQVQAVLTGVYGRQQAPSQPSIKLQGQEIPTTSEGNGLSRKYEDSGGGGEINNNKISIKRKNSATALIVDTTEKGQKGHHKFDLVGNGRLRLKMKRQRRKKHQRQQKVGVKETDQRIKIERHDTDKKGHHGANKNKDSPTGSSGHVNPDDTLLAELNNPEKKIGKENAAHIKLIPQALDIPPRYLKIPHSNRGLEAVVSSMRLRHPCVRRKDVSVSEDNGVRDGLSSLEKTYFLKLCKNDEDDYDNIINNNGDEAREFEMKNKNVEEKQKHARKNLRHKHRRKKQHPKYQANNYNNIHKNNGFKHENHKAPTIIVRASEPREKKAEENVSDNPNKLRWTAEKEKPSSVYIKEYHNYIPEPQGDTNTQGLVTSKDEKIVKPGGGNLKQASVFPQIPITNSNLRTNVTSVERQMEMEGRDFTPNCLSGQNIGSHQDNNNELNPEHFKKLIGELQDNNCWQSGALMGIYHLEQLYKRYHSTAIVNSRDRSTLDQLSESDVEGLDRILCYLLDQLDKCKNNGVINNNVNSMKSIQSFINPPITTTTAATTTEKTQQQTDIKTTSSTKTAKTTTENTQQAFYQDGFDLNWEANLLFY